MRKSLVTSFILVALAACQRVSMDQNLVANNDDVRARAVIKLTALPEKKKAQLVPVLIAKMKDPESRIANRAADALVAIGQPALPSLETCLKEKDPFVRITALSAIGQLGDSAKSAVPIIMVSLNDPHPLAREEAALTLGKIGQSSPKALAAAQETLQQLNLN